MIFVRTRLGISSIVWTIIGVIISVIIGVALYVTLTGTWTGITHVIVEAKRTSVTILEVVVRVPIGGPIVIKKVEFEFIARDGSKSLLPPSKIGASVIMASLNGEDITETVRKNPDLVGLSLKGGDMLVVDYRISGDMTASRIDDVVVYTNVGTSSANVIG